MDNDWTTRTALLLGTEGMRRLAASHVLVVGLGGVGAYAAEEIARAGVGRMTLVDADVVSLSNLNRQLPALHSTLGKLKAEVMAARLRDINPDLEIEVRNCFVRDEETEALLDAAHYDFVVDAIDTVSAKIALAELAQRENIPVISSMGTGNKLHPEMFRIADLSKTRVCPLCRVMRKELKNRGILHLKVLYSEEKPVDTAGRATGEDPGARRSVPGSISFVPPAAGLIIAGEVIRTLAGI